MIADSPALRDLLGALLPGISIVSSPAASGQRVVYFCDFIAPTKPAGMEKWGRVVVKVSEGISASQIAYLEKEIEILNSLRSRHYPKLLWNETFTEDLRTSEKLPNRLFVTIEECIESRPLRALMANYRRPKAALELLTQLIEALEPLWMHRLKLVHRDLKPENILIRANGEVAIIDLGIVREEGAKGVTLSFFPYGPCTPHYASPEQAKNDKRNITFKSDFFSLGVIAYELIAGQLPFGAYDADNAEVLENVVKVEPKPLASLGVCPEEVSNIVSRLMQKEPYKRHRTIELLKTDISTAAKSL
jgi:serine/threonine-protein kinase